MSITIRYRGVSVRELALLSMRSKRRSASELAVELALTTGGALAPAQSTVYEALRGLEVEDKARRRGGVWCLTDAGREEADELVGLLRALLAHAA